MLQEKKTEKEVETEGQQLLSGQAAVLESQDNVSTKSCFENMKCDFIAQTGLKAKLSPSL